MKIGISAALFAAAAFAAAPVAQADVYKWKDASGNVHYGDQPANGAEKVSTGPDNSEAAPDTSADDAQQKRDAECKRKRDQLDTYQKASRIVEKDALGNEKEYDAKDKEALMAVQQAKVKEACKGVLTSSTPSPKPAAPAAQ